MPIRGRSIPQGRKQSRIPQDSERTQEQNAPPTTPIEQQVIQHLDVEHSVGVPDENADTRADHPSTGCCRQDGAIITEAPISAQDQGSPSTACAAGQRCLVPDGLCVLVNGSFPHSCKHCGKFCHAFCGTHDEGEEGYGSKLTCFSCSSLQSNIVKGTTELGVVENYENDVVNFGTSSAADKPPQLVENSQRKEYCRYDGYATILLLKVCLDRDVSKARRGNKSAVWDSVARELNRAMARQPHYRHWHVSV